MQEAIKSMEILEYASCPDKNNFLRQIEIRQIERYEWKAAKYLAAVAFILLFRTVARSSPAMVPMSFYCIVAY